MLRRSELFSQTISTTAMHDKSPKDNVPWYWTITSCTALQKFCGISGKCNNKTQVSSLLVLSGLFCAIVNLSRPNFLALPTTWLWFSHPPECTPISDMAVLPHSLMNPSANETIPIAPHRWCMDTVPNAALELEPSNSIVQLFLKNGPKQTHAPSCLTTFAQIDQLEISLCGARRKLLGLQKQWGVCDWRVSSPQTDLPCSECRPHGHMYR